MSGNRIEPAKTGRSRCRYCNKKLTKGELRIKLPSYWRHLECVVKVYRIRKWSEKPSGLRGWYALNMEQKEEVKSILYPRIPTEGHIEHMIIDDLKKEMIKFNLSPRYEYKSELIFRLRKHLHNLLVIGYCSSLESKCKVGTMTGYIKYIVLRYYTSCHDDKYKSRENDQSMNAIDPILWKTIKRKIFQIVNNSDVNKITTQDITDELKILFPGFDVNNKVFKKQINQMAIHSVHKAFKKQMKQFQNKKLKKLPINKCVAK